MPKLVLTLWLLLAALVLAGTLLVAPPTRAIADGMVDGRGANTLISG